MAVITKEDSKMQALFNVYKHTLEETRGDGSQDVEEKISPNKKESSKESQRKFLTLEYTKRCATRARIVFKICIKASEKKALDDERLRRRSVKIMSSSECAKKFSGSYPKCFFGDSLSSTSDMESHPGACSKVCSVYMDRCLILSSKLEQFLCMNGRDSCIEKCADLIIAKTSSFSSRNKASKKPERLSPVATTQSPILTNATDNNATSETAVLPKEGPDKAGDSTLLKAILKKKLSDCNKDCVKLEKECKQLTNNAQICFFANVECQRTCRQKLHIEKIKIVGTKA